MTQATYYRSLPQDLQNNQCGFQPIAANAEGE